MLHFLNFTKHGKIKAIILICFIFYFISFAFIPKKVSAYGMVVYDFTNYQRAWTYETLIDFPTQKGHWITDVAHKVQDFMFNKYDFVKEYVLDGLAWTAANVIIDKFSDSLVTWIQSGFEGSPMFLSDPEGFFKDTANDISGAIINDLNMNWLCDSLGKFQFDLTFFLPGTSQSQYACTFEDIVSNIESIVDRDKLGDWIDVNVDISQQNVVKRYGDDFRNGGWWMWLSTAESKNNNIGRTKDAANAIYSAAEQAKNKEKFGLSINGGFFGMRKCEEYREAYDTSGKQTKGDCAKWVDTTPGQLVQDQLNQSANKDLARLQVADEIDEIIGALATTMIGWLLTGGNDESGVLGYDKDAEYSGSNRDHYGELSKSQQTTKKKTNITSQISNAKEWEEQYSDELSDYSDYLFEAKENLETVLAKLECIYATSTGDTTYDYSSCDDDIESVGKNLSAVDKTKSELSDDINSVSSDVSGVDEKISKFIDKYGENATSTVQQALGIIEEFEDEVMGASTQAKIQKIIEEYDYSYNKDNKTIKISGLFGDKNSNTEPQAHIMAEKNPITEDSDGSIKAKIYWKAANMESCETKDGDSAWKKTDIGTAGSYTTTTFSDGESRSYKIKCEDENGDDYEDEVSISADSSTASDLSGALFAKQIILESGDETYLYWLSTNAEECRLFSDKDSFGGEAEYASGSTEKWYKDVGHYLKTKTILTTGQATSAIEEQTSYKLICSDSNGDFSIVSELEISTETLERESYRTHTKKQTETIRKEGSKAKSRMDDLVLKDTCLLDEYTNDEDVTSSECSGIEESSSSASST